VSRVLKPSLVAIAALVGAALVVTGGMRVAERQRTAAEVNSLRDELLRARVSADRCRSSLETSQASLLDLGGTIDSLRTRVGSFQTMEGGGVPAERYDEYLEVFDSYNDSVTSWEGRERRLRATEASCRETIQGHNAISDSLQIVLRGAGIEPG
jgi:hypothetical protein